MCTTTTDAQHFHNLQKESYVGDLIKFQQLQMRMIIKILY